MAKGSGKVRGITIELTADTAGIMDGLKDINKELSATDKALKDTNKLLRFDENNTELVAQQQQYLAQAIEQTEEKLKKEKELLAQLQSADNADETVEQQNALKREIEATTQKLNGYKSQLNDTDNALEEVKEETEQAKEQTNIFGDVLKANLASDVILGAVRKLAEGITDISKSAFDTGTAFESSMSQVAATMGMTTDEIAKGSDKFILLSNAAKKCGEETMFSASQAGDALNYLALAGYDAEKAAATLPKVLTLAAAGGLDLAYASDLVTDSMAALGMETEELDNYIDEMAKTAQKSNTSVAQLGEATLVCAGAVSLTEQDLETMNAELGVLANNGIKGAEGGTHLRNVLLSLSAPTDKAEIALHDLGVEVKDSDGNMRNLNDIMIDLNASLADMGSADKANMIKTIFNKTDIAAVNALMKATTGEFQALKGEISDCAGAAEEMQRTMTDNLQGKLTILNSALEGLGIAFYEVFDDNAKNAVDGATSAVGQLTDAIKDGDLGVSLENLSEQFEVLMDDFINFATDALPGVIDGAAWFLENLGTITSLLEALGAGYLAYEVATVAATIATEGFTVALSLNPIGLAVAAVAGLTTAFIALSDEANKLDPKLETFIRSCDNVANKATKLADSTNQMTDSFDGQYEIAHRLAQRIDELSDPMTGLVTDQREASKVVGELNALMPELNLYIDEQGNVLSSTTEGWRDYIDEALNQAQLESMTERLTELEKEKLEVEEQMIEINNQLSDSAKMLIEANDEYAYLQEHISELTEEQCRRYTELSDADMLLEKGQRELIQSYFDTQDAMTELNNSEDILLDKMEESRAKTEEATQATDDYADGLDGAGESVTTLQGLLSELDEDYEKNKEKAVESLNGQRDAFENLKEGASESVEDIAEHLQKQAEGMKEYAELIAEAKAIMDEQPSSEGLLNYYISAGPEAAGELENLVEAFNAGGESAESFKEACEAFSETQELIDGLADLNEALSTGSSEAIDMALEALDVSLPEMEAAFQASWEQQEADAEAYKTQMTETTTQTITDMTTAVTTNEPKLTTAVQTMGDNAVKKLKEAWKWSDDLGRFQVWYDMGMAVDESLAQGITDGTSTVCAAVQAMCEEVVASVDISGLTARIDAALGEALGG